MNIVIVGGGAGGLELVVALGRIYKHHDDINIILVDQSLTHVWKPLLHEVATGRLNNVYDKMGYLALAKKNYFQFELGRLKKIDRQNKSILIENPTEQSKPAELTITYDILVLAIGSVTNNYHIPGTSEFCYHLDFEPQAKEIYRLFFRKLIAKHYQKSKKPIQVVIVGGGATGIEFAAHLHTSLSALSALMSPKNASETMDKIVAIRVIESASRILSPLPEKLSDSVQKSMLSMGVDILTNTRVIEVMEQGVKTHENQLIEADLVIWVAGIKGQDELKTFADFELNAMGQIKVKPTLQTTVDDAIFAMGDCACCMMLDGRQVPARAQAAHQQAGLLVHSIQHVLNKKPLEDYSYKDYGSLVSLSHKMTSGALVVGQKRNVSITGFFARMVYLSLYKSHQIKIIGLWKVSIMTVANFLMRRVRSALKLH